MIALWISLGIWLLGVILFLWAIDFLPDWDEVPVILFWPVYLVIFLYRYNKWKHDGVRNKSNV